MGNGKKFSAAIAVTVIGFAAATGTATARPSSDWPKPATEKNIKKKIGLAQWRKAERVAYCETGGRVSWYVDRNGDPTAKYVSMMGMYVHTYNYGRRATGYRGRNKAEQIGIAIGAHPITGGWSGWGCGGA
jgi:hypothetical protein